MDHLDTLVYRRIKNSLDERKEYQDFIHSNSPLDIHFYPLHLSDIIEICYNKTRDKYANMEFSVRALIEITVDVLIKLIRQNRLGYNKVNFYEHTVLHSCENESLINNHHIYGDYMSFINEYRNYIPESTLENIKEVLVMNNQKVEDLDKLMTQRRAINEKLSSISSEDLVIVCDPNIDNASRIIITKDTELHGKIVSLLCEEYQKQSDEINNKLELCINEIHHIIQLEKK